MSYVTADGQTVEISPVETFAGLFALAAKGTPEQRTEATRILGAANLHPVPLAKTEPPEPRSFISHTEAQELHELIGAAIEAEDYRGLRRAREIAALIVSDTWETESAR